MRTASDNSLLDAFLQAPTVSAPFTSTSTSTVPSDTALIGSTSSSRHTPSLAGIPNVNEPVEAAQRYESVKAEDLTKGQTGRCSTGVAGVAGVAPTVPTHSIQAVVQYLLLNPDSSPTQVAAAFNQKRGWFLTLLASDNFQAALDPVRHLLTDPAITTTLKERFQALTLQSLAVLGEKLEGKEVSELLVLKAAELGIKALGLGIAKREEEAPPAAPVTVDALADRLVTALEKQRKNSRLPVTIITEQE